MKIDVFTHVLPIKYLEALRKKAKPGLDITQISPWVAAQPALSQIDLRLRVMDRYPGVVNVLALATPPLQEMVTFEDAVDLAKLANDELCELVAKYPDRFIAAVACLPLADTDAAIREADRAIQQLNFRGVQIFTNTGGSPVDAPRLRPLYERMVQHDLPIWIHPWDSAIMGFPTRTQSSEVQNWVPPACRAAFGWDFEMSVAMMRLAMAGIFRDLPNIKFIAHHAGGIVSFLEKRIHIEQTVTDLKKFYVDTAIYGNTPALMCAHAFFGTERMLFATDMPLGAAKFGYGNTLITIRAIEEMGIPAAEKDKIFTGNAMRLLKLLI